MTALPLQLVATLENLTHNTQHALAKAKEMDPENVAETSEEPGPFEDVCEYVGDLTTLTTSGSGLSGGGKITSKGGQEAVYLSFTSFCNTQQDLFVTLTFKARDIAVKVKVANLVTKLEEYEKSFDTFIDQLASQCPAVADDIISGHKAINEKLKKAVAAWT